MNNKKHHKKLTQKTRELKEELDYRKDRLKYNIIAGICKKSIKSQEKIIEKLKSHVENIEYINQHDINDDSQIQ